MAFSSHLRFCYSPSTLPVEFVLVTALWMTLWHGCVVRWDWMVSSCCVVITRRPLPYPPVISDSYNCSLSSIWTLSHPPSDRCSWHNWGRSVIAPLHYLSFLFVAQGSHASCKVLNFFLENSRTSKVLKVHFFLGKSWKLKLKVPESPKKIRLKVMHFSSASNGKQAAVV